MFGKVPMQKWRAAGYTREIGYMREYIAVFGWGLQFVGGVSVRAGHTAWDGVSPQYPKLDHVVLVRAFREYSPLNGELKGNLDEEGPL